MHWLFRKQEPGPQLAQQVPSPAPSGNTASRSAGQDAPVGTDSADVNGLPWYEPLLPQSFAGTWHLCTVVLHEPDAHWLLLVQLAP